MRLHLFLYFLFWFGQTTESACPDLCDCEQILGAKVRVDCTGRELHHIPVDLPCHVGRAILSSNYIARLGRESFSCHSQMNILLLSNNMIKHIEKGVFENATQLVYIQLDSSYLQTIPYLGSLPLIRHINVIRNSLLGWSQEALPNTSERRLFRLALANNKLHNLPKIPFKVAELNLEGNQITDLSTTMFTYPQAIVVLLMSYNNVEYLDKLQTMENLKSLFLEFNRIRSITNGVFNHFPSLEDIYLSGNQIVDASTFRNMSCIKEIILEDNKIRFVGTPAFTNIPNIVAIILNGNRIVQFMHGPSFSAPFSLALVNNKLSTLDMHRGTNCSEIRLLNVRGNDLPNISVCDLPELATLDAANNKITDVSFGIHGHNNLEYINLKGNQITDIKKFGSLPNVKWLLLNGNSLTMWDDKNLIHSTRLLSLRLRSNQLSVLSNFTALPRLKLLDLSGNILQTIENSTFHSLPQLTTLNLNHNEISSLGFLASMTSLSKLFLSQNRLKVINWQDFTGLINLASLELAFNFIVEIDTGINLPSLQSLDISHNSIFQMNFHQLFDNQRTMVRVNIEHNDITQLVSTSVLDINANNNAIGSSNSSFISGANIFLCNNNLKDFKQVRISSTLVGLYLNKNQIIRIPADTFISASSLWFLELDDNLIVDISPSSFIGLSKVYRLSLKRNHLVHLPTGVFSNILELKHLHLDGNPLTYISNKQFSAAQGIYSIYFSSIPPFNTSLQIIRDLQTIEFLNLHNNLAFSPFFMNKTSNTSYLEFPNLKILNLSSNQLENHCVTLKMKNLGAIDLSTNMFTSIPTTCLPKVSKAYSLYLSWNKITKVSTDSLDIHQQFWLLDLSYNRIVSFELGSLRHQTYLTYLDLEGNLLTKLDVSFLTFSLKFIMMDPQKNPWICGCDLIKTFHAIHPVTEPILCGNPHVYDFNSSLAELAASDALSCRPQMCSHPHQTLLSFVGDTDIEIPCPIITSNHSNVIHWIVALHGQQLRSTGNTLPDGISILPHNALLISYVSKNMTGLYSCWSENEAGQTKLTANLLIGEKTKNGEEQGSNLKAMSVRKWTDTLSCGKSGASSSNQSFHVLFLSMVATKLAFLSRGAN